MQILTALRISKVTAIAFLIVGMFWGALAAQMPVLKARIGADDALFGMLLLATSLGLFTTMFLAPRMDRALRSWALPAAALILAVSFILPGLATTPTAFFFAMTFAGLGSGLLDVIMNARVAELEARHHQSLMNFNHGMFSLGYCIAALGTGVAREAEWLPVSVFFTLFLITLCLLPFLKMGVAPQSEDEKSSGRFPHAIVALCGFVVLIAFMGEASVESWSALHIERTLGGRAAEGALGPAMLGLTMAIGRFSGAAASERLGDLRLIALATLLASFGAIVAAFAPSPPVAYLGFGIIGLGVSVIGPLGLAIVGRLVEPGQRVTAIARAAVIGFSGFFLAPAIMGLVSDAHGLRVAFAGVTILMLCVLPALPVLRRMGG